MEIKKNTLILGIIFLILVYLANVFVFVTFYKIINVSTNIWEFIFPLLITLFFLILVYVCYTINEKLYCIAFYISNIYLGYLLYTFLVAIPVRFFDTFINFRPWIGLMLLFIPSLLICIYGFFNARSTKVQKITLKNEKYSGKCKILHLSDIHLGPIYQIASSQKIVNEINALNPDIVVITGDFVDGTLNITQEWLSPFDTLTIPILYVTGNHEVMYGKDEFLKLISNTRIKHIGNNNFEFKGINFVGADWEDDLDTVIYKTNKNEKSNCEINVLINHAPTKFPSDLSDTNIFLMLCGHTHGGQLFPFNIFAYFANNCFRGLYSTTNEKNLHYVYVSEGVNTAMIPMRVGSHRIFGLITIEGEKIEEKNNFEEKY